MCNRDIIFIVILLVISFLGGIWVGMDYKDDQ